MSTARQDIAPHEHTTTDASAERWLLIMLCAAQFLVVLNFQTVALTVPALTETFGVAPQTTQWVIGAFELAYGGALLLAGRLSDLLGHRRVLVFGIGMFTLAALVCGFAPTIGVLIAARVAQGIATALFTPAALGALSNGFAEGAARTRALGVWGMVGPLGGIVGIVLGGVLAGWGWSWVFWLNVPIGLLTLAGMWRFVPSGSAQRSRPSFDVLGALTGSAAIVALTTALTLVQNGGGAVLLAFGLALVLLVVFVVVERRVREPLVPFALIRVPAVIKANGLAILHAAATNTPIFFFVLYMQQVQNVSPFRTGLSFLPINLGIIAGTVVGTALIKRTGPRLPAIIGMVLIGAGLVVFTLIDTTTSYLAVLLPGLLLQGTGLGLGAVAINIAGSDGLSDDVHGSAWGLLNTSVRVGTAVGLSLLVTVAAVMTPGAAVSAAPEALIVGWRWAFGTAAGIAGLGVVLAAWLPAKRV